MEQRFQLLTLGTTEHGQSLSRGPYTTFLILSEGPSKKKKMWVWRGGQGPGTTDHVHGEWDYYWLLPLQNGSPPIHLYTDLALGSAGLRMKESP